MVGNKRTFWPERGARVRFARVPGKSCLKEERSKRSAGAGESRVVRGELRGGGGALTAAGRGKGGCQDFGTLVTAGASLCRMVKGKGNRGGRPVKPSEKTEDKWGQSKTQRRKTALSEIQEQESEMNPNKEPRLTGARIKLAM